MLVIGIKRQCGRWKERWSGELRNLASGLILTDCVRVLGPGTFPLWGSDLAPVKMKTLGLNSAFLGLCGKGRDRGSPKTE